MALNAANVTLKLLDSAESVESTIYTTAVICLGVAIVVFIIIAYFIATNPKQENMSNDTDATIITLFGDFRGEDPLMLYKYYPGESLDRVFSAKLRSGTIKTGAHRVQMWYVVPPITINSNPYTYLRDINDSDSLPRLNPAMYALIADIPPHTESDIVVEDVIEKIRLRVTPL